MFQGNNNNNLMETFVNEGVTGRFPLFVSRCLNSSHVAITALSKQNRRGGWEPFELSFINSYLKIYAADIKIIN